jgi:hypothetical protein
MVWVAVASPYPWAFVGRTYVNLDEVRENLSPYCCLVLPKTCWESTDVLMSPFHGHLQLSAFGWVERRPLHASLCAFLLASYPVWNKMWYSLVAPWLRKKGAAVRNPTNSLSCYSWIVSNWTCWPLPIFAKTEITLGGSSIPHHLLMWTLRNQSGKTVTHCTVAGDKRLASAFLITSGILGKLLGWRWRPKDAPNM